MSRSNAARWVRTHRIDLIALVVSMGAVVAIHAAGWTAATRDTFEFMGFDTDRAVLLTAGLGAMLAAAVAALVGGHRWTWSLAGLLGFAALFGRTFAVESQRAFHGDPALGSLDLGGWLLTLGVLLASSLLVGTAAGILAAESGTAVRAAAGAVRAAIRNRSASGLPWGRVAVTAIVMLALVISTPALGQLLNFGADSMMWSNAPAGVPLVGTGTPADVLPTPSPGSSVPPAAPIAAAGSSQAPGRAPWLAWLPTGTGTVVERSLPAPWVGGRSTVADFWVYLPPGYGQGTRRYPVIYELPWPIALYDNGAQIRPTLDRLIDSGSMPPSIVVFLSSGGGPFTDNECIDAAGGREWFDSFITAALVPYIDASFRTIARADARALLGDSQGGFCAANVLLHHPGVFHQEISFSGYYWAALLLALGPSAQAPYAKDLALARANSPMLIASSIPAALRGRMLFVLIGNPQQPFFGAQMTRFAAYAHAIGYSIQELVTPYGHSWIAVRAMLPAALAAIGWHEAQLGVFTQAG